MGCIDPRFFDKEIYAIYRAVNEKIGEETWWIVWRAGEILLDELWGELGLSSLGLGEALKKLGEWLKSVGYVEDIEVRLRDGEAEYIMTEPVITPGAKRLIDEGMVPPHISTSLLFALLKRYGYRAEMAGDPVFLEDGRVLERWRLVKLDE